MHKFFDMSIKKKFIVIMILASILPMAVFGVYAYTTSTRSLELQTQNSATQALSRSWLYLDLSLQQVFDYANNLAKDYRIIEALKNVTNDGADATINSQIWSMKKEIRIPLKVLIISKDSRWFSDYETDSSKISDAVDTIKNEQWYKNRDIFNFQTVFLGVKKNYVKDFETDSHLYLYRSIVSDTGEFLGIVLLDINSYTFDRLLSSSINRTSDLMYLVDDKNCIVSFSDENIDGVDKYGKNISEYLGFNPISDVFNNRYIIQNTKLTNENWTILYFINKQSIYNETRKIEFFAIGIICILVVMEFLLYLFVNRSITNPITMMAKAMKKVQNSDFEIVLEAKTSDEIGVLSIGFNKMVAEIKNLIDKIRYEEKQLRNLEFSMLQAQIKPHFLYNSLNGIKLLAEMEGRDNISKSITALIKLLQYSIGSIEETLTLCKEVEYLESYIFLNNIDLKTNLTLKLTFLKNMIILGYSNL